MCFYCVFSSQLTFKCHLLLTLTEDKAALLPVPNSMELAPGLTHSKTSKRFTSNLACFNKQALECVVVSLLSSDEIWCTFRLPTKWLSIQAYLVRHRAMCEVCEPLITRIKLQCYLHEWKCIYLWSFIHHGYSMYSLIKYSMFRKLQLSSSTWVFYSNAPQIQCHFIIIRNAHLFHIISSVLCLLGSQSVWSPGTFSHANNC